MTKHLERHHQTLPVAQSLSTFDGHAVHSHHNHFDSQIKDQTVYMNALVDLMKEESGDTIEDATDPGDGLSQWNTVDYSGSQMNAMEQHDAVKEESRQEGGQTEIGSWLVGGSGSAVSSAEEVASSWESSIKPTAKRNRRTKHPVWELFRRTSSGQAQCQLCNAFVRSPCSSNFMGHLNRHHSEHYQEIYTRWLNGRRPLSESSTSTPSSTLTTVQPSTPTTSMPTLQNPLAISFTPTTTVTSGTVFPIDFSSQQLGDYQAIPNAFYGVTHFGSAPATSYDHHNVDPTQFHYGTSHNAATQAFDPSFSAYGAGATQQVDVSNSSSMLVMNGRLQYATTPLHHLPTTPNMMHGHMHPQGHHPL